MQATTIDNTEWLMRLIAPQSREVKLDIIRRLSVSLMKKTRKEKSRALFANFSADWGKGMTTEEYADMLRHSHIEQPREVENWRDIN